jgi:hypothetical protein
MHKKWHLKFALQENRHFSPNYLVKCGKKDSDHKMDPTKMMRRQFRPDRDVALSSRLSAPGQDGCSSSHLIHRTYRSTKKLARFCATTICPRDHSNAADYWIF